MLDLTDLKLRKISELVEMARVLRVENAASLKKQELIFEILRNQPGSANARGEGVLEILPDGFGFLRAPDCNYLAGPDDIYVSPSQVRRFNLRTGDTVSGVVRAPKEGERYFALIKVESIGGRNPDTERDKLLIDNLTPVHPSRPLRLEHRPDGLGTRAIDLLAPLGLGQRALLLAPPRAGRTSLLREIAQGVRKNHPEAALLVLLIDERPEEVTEMTRSVDAEVLSSTFDEPPARHVQVADMGIERAKRLVEQGRDVVVIIDSLTRLARACHATATAGGRLLGGVLDAGAAHRVRRSVAAARALEEGGSLTLIGAVLTDTDARIDEVTLDELRGTANAEIVLSGALAELGVFPALEIAATHTRHAERLVDPGRLARIARWRRSLPVDPAQATEQLIDRLRATASNSALLDDLP